MELKGMFKNKYELRGKDWINHISPEDRQVLIFQGLKYALYGKLGGMVRAKSAMRDEKGKFVKEK